MPLRYAVMSAGVHRARVFRYVFMIVLFEDGERVHIGADGTILAAFADLCDDAGLPDPAPDAVPHLFHFIRDDLRCAVKLEADLGVHVEIAPPFDEFL
jgi:hypothetical protein